MRPAEGASPRSPEVGHERTPSMYAFLLSTAVIFVAELGDKSFFLTVPGEGYADVGT